MSLVTNTNDLFKKGVVGNVRKAQEDSHDWALKTPNGDVFVVCDGMGGHVGGARASSLAVEYIIKQLKEKKYDDPYQALKEALECANMQILGFANDHPEYKGMGTTACIILMQNDGAWIAHVGDSRIYLFLGKEKKLHRITKDHSYVQTLVDAEIITDEQAEHHEHKNRILKALGVTPDLQPSYGKVIPKNGDIFLMCSDGLSGMIPDRTIERVLGQNTSLEERGELLIKLAMEGETVQPGGQDNCTLELIQVDSSPWPKSEYTSYNPKRTGKGGGKKGSHSVIKIIIVTVALLVALGVAGMYVKKKIEVSNHKTELNNKLKTAKTDSNLVAYKICSIDEGIRVKEQDSTCAKNNEQKDLATRELKTLRQDRKILSDSLANLKNTIAELNAEISPMTSCKKQEKKQDNESNNNRQK